MARKKATDQAALYKHPIRTRVDGKTHIRLEKLLAESDCRTIGEIARKILSNEKITILHRDISMSQPMEELVGIRREIRAIGININQQTHRFHTSQSTTERLFHAQKTATVYKGIEPKIDRLLILVSRLAEKWLQKS